eukprot:m.81771 g.81771  ORF g.81771 m.81771 type:complete len:179 (-) comp14580_c0_seq1:298-834(-)
MMDRSKEPQAPGSTAPAEACLDKTFKMANPSVTISYKDIFMLTRTQLKALLESIVKIWLGINSGTPWKLVHGEKPNIDFRRKVETVKGLSMHLDKARRWLKLPKLPDSPASRDRAPLNSVADATPILPPSQACHRQASGQQPPSKRANLQADYHSQESQSEEPYLRLGNTEHVPRVDI